MLLFTLMMFKLGFDDARFFCVAESDLWLCFFIALLLSQSFNQSIILWLVILCTLQLGVWFKWCGNGDRDILIILLFIQSYDSWTITLLIASGLSMIHGLIKQKKKIPFIFFLSLGHFLNFCLKTL